MPALLSLGGVTKRFRRGLRETTVLDNVSLDVRRGDFVGVLGGRREGKSTLLEIAAGMVRPDEGRVVFDGIDLGSAGSRERDRLRRSAIGLVRGRTAAAGQTGRVLDHVALPLLSDGATVRQARRTAAETLARVGATEYVYADLPHLSESEQLRVALAQAYVRSPRLLIVDELTDTLDLNDRNTILGILQGFADEDEVAILMTAADAHGTAGCSRVVLLSGGRLRDPERLRDRDPDPADQGDVIPFRSRDDGAGTG
jgi:putative ABC transport system ATP-binding protein